MSGRHGLRANRLVPMGQSSRHERQDKGRSGGRDDPGHVVAFSRGGAAAPLPVAGCSVFRFAASGRSRSWLSLDGPFMTLVAIAATVVPAFYAELFLVHAAITQPFAIEMRCRWRAGFAKLDAIVLTFAKLVFQFACAQQVTAIAALRCRGRCRIGKMS